MTKRETQAFARIVAEHEMAAAQAAALEANQGIPFPDTLKGCLATDDRILTEVMNLRGDAARRWRDRAIAWMTDPRIFGL